MERVDKATRVMQAPPEQVFAANADPGRGKSTADSDVVNVRIVDVVPGRRIVQAVDFESDDAAFAGTMTMTWELTPSGDSTRVEIRAVWVPPGISAEDHAVGLASSPGSRDAERAA